MGFGLNNKEAQCYFYLLRYGPKTPSPLAKALRTYREDVHRTLNSLIDKGMVRPSLDSPTVYTAVELDVALEAALKKHEAELREMEQRKRELEELARQQQFRPPDEVSTFKIIKGLGELLSLMLPAISTLNEQWDMLVPESAVIMASQFGVNPFTEEFIERGGRVRILITDFSYALVPLIRELDEIGADVRYLGQQGLLFTVLDKRIGVSAINVNTKLVKLNQLFTALWTDDPTYAGYLTSTFETMWSQAVPAGERIEVLATQRSSQVEQ